MPKNRRDTNKLTPAGVPLPANLRRPQGRPRNRKARETDLVCTDVRRWSELLADPFDGDPTGVFMPLAEDDFPCNATTFRNWATMEITPATPDSTVDIWAYPDASTVNTGGDIEQRFCEFLGGGNHLTGVPINYSNATNGVGAAAGYTESVGGVMQCVALSATLRPITYQPLLVPNPIVGATGSGFPQRFRTLAWGIRISFVNRLADTEGWVEAVNPYEIATSFGVGNSPDFEAMRNDPSFRRHFFGDRRTMQYTWHPNCDAVKYWNIDPNTPSPHNIASRLMLRVGGLRAGSDKILVEIVHHVSMTSPTLGFLNIPNPITTDEVHVKNAIAEFAGQQNPKLLENGRVAKGRKLHHHVLLQKVKKHPYLRKLSGTVEDAFAAGGLYSGGKALLSGVSKLLAEAPEAVAANPELLLPLLAG